MPQSSLSRKLQFDRSAWKYYTGYFSSFKKSILGTSIVSALQGLIIIPQLLIIKYAFDVAIPEKSISMLMWIGVGILLIQIIDSLISIGLKSVHIRIIHEAIFNIRKDLVMKLFSLSRSFHTNSDQGLIHTRVVQDTERLSNMSNSIVSNLLPAIFSSTALCFVLLWVNWSLFLILIALFPLIYLSNKFMGKRIKSHVYKFQRDFEDFNSGIRFILRNIDLSRTQSAEPFEQERQFTVLKRLKKATVRMFLINSVNGNLQTIIRRLSAVLIIIVGGSAAANGSITIGALISFFIASTQLNSRIANITQSFSDIVTGNESVNTLHTLMLTDDPEPYSGTRKIDIAGNFKLNRVTFSYDSRTVLEDINLELNSGTCTAIIGDNGTGKTTLTNLILGFYKPNTGSITVEGQPYEALDISHIRKSIGLVPQEPQLFSGTIRENITYGSIDSLSDEYLKIIASISTADSFIYTLEHALDTQIGDGGVLVSGGERQKIAIMRALIGNPKLLILDEPTNHLDIHSIHAITQNISTLEFKPAILLISHDDKVTQMADTVYSLKDGFLEQIQ